MRNIVVQDAVGLSKSILEQRLREQFPRIKTAYEGVNFTPPEDELYFVVKYIPRKVDDPTLGSMYYREHIELQVFVVDVLGKGTGNALSIASQVRSLFDKGLTITETTEDIIYRVNVFRTPQVSGSSVLAERLIVPVLVTVVVESYRKELSL